MRMRRSLKAKIRRRRNRRTVSAPTSRRKRRSLSPIRRRPATEPASGHLSNSGQTPHPGHPSSRSPRRRVRLSPRRRSRCELSAARWSAFHRLRGGPPPPPPGNPYSAARLSGSPAAWPQQPWAPGPPPKKRGNGWKWGLGAVALLVVIGVTAAVTISVTRRRRRRWRSHADGRYLRLGKRRRQGPCEYHHRGPELRGVEADHTTLADDSEKGLG